MKLSFIVPGDPAQRTGGYIYDARIVAELRRLGHSVEVIGLAGRFPQVDQAAIQSMDRALSDCPDEQIVVIDGLALGGLPQIAESHAQRLRLVGLVHHPLADETGLDASARQTLMASEKRALAATQALIATSHFTARRLAESGLSQQPVWVIEPGVDPAALAERSRQHLSGAESERPDSLLCVASLTPRKGQDLLVQALARLTDYRWHCALIGSLERAPEFAEQVRRLIEQHRLQDRIELAGEADAQALELAYQGASLCLLPSWYEGYGMVISEALAHGLPLISTTGGALIDTVPESSALRVPPGNVAALTGALERWFSEPELRGRLIRNSARERDRLSDWPSAGRDFAEHLERLQ